MSAGIGQVPVAQTYLDIGQGNRVFDSLYGSQLAPLKVVGHRVRGWGRAAARARTAPAEIVPGLLTSALREADLSTVAAPRLGPAALISADGRGYLGRASHLRVGLEVRFATLRQVRRLVAGLAGEDLLIAIERPLPSQHEALAIGIAGQGFSGDLTSPSTRMDGYVLSTDLAPTILTWLGLAVPPQMSGQPIGSDASLDPTALVSLQERLAAIPSRRGPVLGLAVAVWLAALLLAIAATRGRAIRTGVRLVGLAAVYLPLVLLGTAALEPGRGTEQLLVILGAPLLGILTLTALKSGYRAVALASALTVFAYAADVAAGSRLTPFALLGPNPGLGVRFYGVGNELAALLAVLIIAGSGAALAGFWPTLSARRTATVFLAVGMPLAFVFAAGPFGADVGSAIAIPAGTATAAAAIATPHRRAAKLLALAGPLAALTLLALIDLGLGSKTHLTDSVLHANGPDQLLEIARRRLQGTVHSFTRPLLLAFMPLLLVACVLATVRRDQLARWLHGLPAMRAGLLGALTATIVGTLANDSGLMLAEIGGVYMLVFVALAWIETSIPVRR
ncbi:MAG: hypothetical protein AB7T48_09905 [Solirubrobacterales bacterium]